MKSGRWFDASFPAEASLVILHPNFGEQHILIPRFLNHEGKTPLCITLRAARTDFETFWSELTEALTDQANLALPPLKARTSPENAAQLALKTLQPISPFVMVIDSFDLAESEALSAWALAFAEKLPKGSQLILAGRRLPIDVLEGRNDRINVAIYPLDPERMLLDYANRPSDRILLEVYGHGTGRVLVNGREIDQWDGMLPRSLFFYFVDRGMVTRDEIFRTFWPTLPVREATNVFHVTKRKISEILGFDLTVYWSGFYRISPDIDLHYDVVRFVENVQNSAVADEATATLMLQRAIYLYRGTFLTTTSASWLEARREDLQMTYVEALSSLARLRERAKAEHEALGLYLRAAAAQPHREDLARSIMSIYHRLGQSHLALDVYSRLNHELKQRLGVTPDKRTVELAEQIRLYA